MALPSGVDRLALLSIHRPLELGLVHRGPALDPHLARLVVELLHGPALRAAVGTQPAPPGRRHVSQGGPRRRLRLAPLGALLVHGPGGDLLGPFRRRAPGLRAVPDVLVLALLLVGPLGSRHGSSFG